MSTISNAVAFLKDPSLADADPTKKVEFLRLKGLSEAEISEALKQAKEASPTSQTISSAPEAQNTTYEHPPPIPERDWKDYFIMATTTALVGYGLYWLFQNVLVPSVAPQLLDALEREKDEISREFERVEKLVEKLDAERTEREQKDAEMSQKLDNVIERVEKLVSAQEELLQKNSDDIKLVKMEIDGIKSAQKVAGLSMERVMEGKLSQIGSELALLSKLVGRKESRSVLSVGQIPSAKDILGAREKSQTPPPQPSSASSQELDRSGIPEWQMRD